MKYFEEPTLEMLRLTACDVLTFSGEDAELPPEEPKEENDPA